MFPICVRYALKSVVLSLSGLVILILAACTGVPQVPREDFARVSKELTDTKSELANSQEELARVSKELADTKSDLIDSQEELLSIKLTLTDYEQISSELSTTQSKYEDLRERASQVSYILQFFVASVEAWGTGDDSKIFAAISSLGKVEDEEIQSALTDLFGKAESMEDMSDEEAMLIFVSLFGRAIELLE